ncbi:MAG TPA: PadR family transcriptional regulator [Acidimicrobiales bacterium]|nr:PadR family transcriptional regulator [Acidimicrobiales bacterium]
MPGPSLASSDPVPPAAPRRRRGGGTLALAVLACLVERPMHPYEMAATLRTRGRGDSIKVNYGSLYAVVEGLRRQGLIEAQETARAGRRPERTVYRVTDAGSAELVSSLAELLSVPTKEYLQYEAGLSLLPVLAPDVALGLLQARARRLVETLDERRRLRAEVLEAGLPRLFVVEYEYMTALLQAELDFTTALVADMEAGTLDGMARWASLHGSAATTTDPVSTDPVTTDTVSTDTVTTDTASAPPAPARGRRPAGSRP